MTLFYGAQLKIDRAKQHISNLRAEFDAFLNSNPYTHEVHLEPNSWRDTNYGITLGRGSAPPESLALITGDAIHNLRSALDHLTWELIGLDGGTQNSQLYFPLGNCRTNYEATAKGIKTPRADTIKFLCGFEAYLGGNGERLYGLGRLDNADKHKIITPTVAAARISGLVDRHFGDRVDFMADINENGEAVFRGARHRDLILDDQTEVALDIFFGDVEIFPRKRILLTLTTLTEDVVNVREDFISFVNNRP